MKKIIFLVGLLFFVHSIQPNLVGELQNLFGDLVDLERKLIVQKFEKLLQDAEENNTRQRLLFHDIHENLLEKISSAENKIKIIGSFKKSMEELFRIEKHYEELIDEINRYLNRKDIKKLFREKLIEHYRKIENIWRVYSRKFKDFLYDHEKSEFFDDILGIEGVQITARSFFYEYRNNINLVKQRLKQIVENSKKKLQSKQRMH